MLVQFVIRKKSHTQTDHEHIHCFVFTITVVILGETMKQIVIILTTTLCLLLSIFANASKGVIAFESQFSVMETVNRFEQLLKSKGLTIFVKIDHARNADTVNLPLRPTQVVIFGNPNVGTLLMQCQQQLAIDLPQKALVWQDEKGKVWLSYNDPRYLQQRHNVKQCQTIVNKVSQLLQSLARSATSNDSKPTQ